MGVAGARQHLLPCALELPFLTARAAAGAGEPLALCALIFVSGCSFVLEDFLPSSSF